MIMQFRLLGTVLLCQQKLWTRWLGLESSIITAHIDSGLREYKEFAHAIMSMPLTADGMFGALFDKMVEGKK